MSSPNLKQASLRQLIEHEISERAADDDAVDDARSSVTTKTLAFERNAMAVTIARVRGGQAQRLALIDQSNFAAEEGEARRQVITLTLSADTLSPSVISDFDQLLEAILAAKKAGPQTRQEKW